jgi:hypothetical protein
MHEICRSDKAHQIKKPTSSFMPYTQVPNLRLSISLHVSLSLSLFVSVSFAFHAEFLAFCSGSGKAACSFDILSVLRRRLFGRKEIRLGIDQQKRKKQQQQKKEKKRENLQLAATTNFPETVSGIRCMRCTHT